MGHFGMSGSAEFSPVQSTKEVRERGLGGSLSDRKHGGGLWDRLYYIPKTSGGGEC